jgi:hypothetical protein
MQNAQHAQHAHSTCAQHTFLYVQRLNDRIALRCLRAVLALRVLQAVMAGEKTALFVHVLY